MKSWVLENVTFQKVRRFYLWFNVLITDDSIVTETKLKKFFIFPNQHVSFYRVKFNNKSTFSYVKNHVTNNEDEIRAKSVSKM